MLSWQFSLLIKFEDQKLLSDKDQKLIFGGWVEESNGGKESNATSVFYHVQTFLTKKTYYKC